MFDVITFGSATRDVILSSKHFVAIPDKHTLSGSALHLELGAKLEVDDVVFETGGGATNTAVTFARQGLKTTFVGKVGREARGDAVLAQVKAEGVDTSLVIKDHDDPTGYSVILHTDTGKRTVLVYRGASSDFKEGEVNWSKMKAKWFYITNLAGREKYLKKVLSLARTNKGSH
jgi:sugar/nucleoside kinase (ribokinase family)